MMNGLGIGVFICWWLRIWQTYLQPLGTFIMLKVSGLHLHQMHGLPNNFPWLYKCFTEDGYHTIRRSDCRWAGHWTDLVIEQVMMRSIHSLGGLTRCRGMTEGDIGKLLKNGKIFR